MKIINLCFITIVGLTSHCTSDSEYETKQIDTSLEQHGKSGDSTYGINENNEAVLQNEKDPGYELMIAKKANQTLFLELERDALALDHCIQEYSSPALGGDGKFKNIEDYEDLRPEYDSSEELGVTEDGKLKLVKKGYLSKQLAQSKEQSKQLRKAIRYVQKELRKCQIELKYAKDAKNNGN